MGFERRRRNRGAISRRTRAMISTTTAPTRSGRALSRRRSTRARRTSGAPTSLSLEDAARVAKRHDCALEVRGGGKRRHAIIHIDSAARREPRSTNVRGARASTKSARGGPAKKTRRRAKPAVQFISGGVARDSDVFIDDDDDEDSRKKPSMEPNANGEPVVYPNRGARRAAEAQARDREFIEKARAKKRGTVGRRGTRVRRV